MIGAKKIKKGQIETYTTADIADSVGKRYQSENQDTFNDATSSIQTQLNTKQTWLVKETAGTTAVTGTTSLTQIGASVFIQANTFSANDVLVLEGMSFKKLVGIGTANVAFYHNTSDTLTGSVRIAVYAMAIATVSAGVRRAFEISGGVLKNIISGASSAVTDIGLSTGSSLSTPFDPTVDNYFFTAVQLGNASDSIVRNQLLILK